MSEAMNRVYEEICARVPFKENPACLSPAPHVEVMVTCTCGAQYRTMVNGLPSIPVDVLSRLEELKCGNCRRTAREASSIAGHSAGVFNAVMALQY